MRTFADALVITVVGASLGCATVPACPAKGGPAWRELTSEHFRVRSDLEENDAREMVRSLEEIRASMLAVMWPGAPGPPNLADVVALDSYGEFQAFARRSELWGVRVRSPPFPAVIVVPRARAVNLTPQMILTHELAHDLSLWFLPLQPTWFAEGIATFLETLSYDRAEHRVRVGAPSRERLAALQSLGRMNAEVLLDPRATSSVRLEATAWLLMHYLVIKRPQELARFQRLVGLLQPADRAWREAMPDLPPDRLDAELSRYQFANLYGVADVSITISPPAVRVRVLADSEVHALRALMYHSVGAPGSPVQDAQARAEVSEALVSDGGNVDALAVELAWFTPQGEPGRRSQLARLATAAHPESWLAWRLAADAAGDNRKEARAALARGLALAPERPEVMVPLAMLDAREGRWQEALAISTKAMRLGGRQNALLAVHMEGLARAGRCPEASFMASAISALVPLKDEGVVKKRWEMLRPICAEAATKTTVLSPDLRASPDGGSESDPPR